MKETLIEFKTAKLAKEKGFNEIIYGFYDGDQFNCYPDRAWKHEWKDKRGETGDYVSAPTQALLQKWLREEHNLSVEIHVGENTWGVKIYEIKDFDIIWSHLPHYNTYEEALEEGLHRALLLIKNK